MYIIIIIISSYYTNRKEVWPREPYDIIRVAYGVLDCNINFHDTYIPYGTREKMHNVIVSHCNRTGSIYLDDAMTHTNTTSLSN